MKEEHQLTENMKKFFDNLLSIKRFVKEKYDETQNDVLKDIFDRLDITIKTTDER
jgi:hypothetical protein